MTYKFNVIVDSATCTKIDVLSAVGLVSDCLHNIYRLRYVIIEKFRNIRGKNLGFFKVDYIKGKSSLKHIVLPFLLALFYFGICVYIIKQLFLISDQANGESFWYVFF